MKFLKVALFLMFAVSASAQFIPTLVITNYTQNWTTFHCDSIATAASAYDTLVLPSGYIANMRIYAFAAEAKFKFTLADSTIEWARIAAASEIEIPGLVKPDTLYILGVGTGSVRVTYTVY